MRSPTRHRVASTRPHLHFIAALLWPLLRASQRCRRKREEKNKKDPYHSLHLNEGARLSPILQARLLVGHGYLCGTDALVRHFFAVDSCFRNAQKKGAANRPCLTIPQTSSATSATSLSYPIPPAALLPPNRGILWTVQHLGQFFLDFHQPVGSHLHRRLIDLTVCTLPSKPGVHVPQIRDFLTKAGEVFQDVWHRFNLTPDSGSSRHFFRPNQQSSLPVPSLPAISMTLIISSCKMVSCKPRHGKNTMARRRTEPEEAKHGAAGVSIPQLCGRYSLPDRSRPPDRGPDRTPS